MLQIKLLFTFILAFFTFQSIHAQTTVDEITPASVRLLVSNATLTLNGIYHEQVAGREAQHTALRKTIYAANAELIGTATLLENSYKFNQDKANQLQKTMLDLQTALKAVNKEQSEADLQKNIGAVTTKALALKMIVKRLK